MTEPAWSIPVLVNKLIDNTLTEEESLWLYERVEQDRDLASLIRKNFIVDYLLHLSKNAQPSWDELVAMERTAKPLAQMTPQELAEYQATVKALNTGNPPPVPTKTDSPADDEPFDPFAVLREQEAREERARALRFQERKPHKWTVSDFFFILSVAVAILLGVAIYEQMQWELGRDARELSDPDAPALARVTDLVEPVWQEGSKTYNRGQGTGAESVALASGLANIVFADGAQVIFEGPGTLEITGGNSLFLRSGKLSVNVPPYAVGFKVVTEQATVIDRGTQFYIDTAGRDLRVATVLGRVDFEADKTTLPLTEGQQVVFDGKKIKETEPWFGDRFIDYPRFTDRLKRYITGLRKIKVREDERIDSDPYLIARFDAMDRSSGNLLNRSLFGARNLPAMSLSGCSRQEGRWPDSYAISFDSSNSYGEFTIQEGYNSMTFCASVQINHLANQGNTLLSSRDFMKTPGAVFWQVTKSGQIAFYITTEESKQEVYITRPIFTRRDFGGWFQLKVVIDGNNETISQFMDGHMISRHRWKNPMKLWPGKMILGNTLEETYRVNDRFWDGAIDELTIYGY
ncbi:MAG: LamG-like jellyroll fold domain-containing protein [Planctomycetia bacterium]|nr:LamG-like jellyroll fold domain-containing protein [Planctomycetia bacterium]